MSAIETTGAFRVPAPRLWRRLWTFVRPHQGKLIGVVSLNLLAAVFDVFSFTLLIPFLNALFDQPQLLPSNRFIAAILGRTIGFLLDPANPMGSLRNVIFLVLLAVAVKNLLVWLSGQVGAQLQEYVVRDLRDRVYTHLLRLPMRWFTTNKVGQAIARVLNDTSNAKTVVTELVTRSIWSGAQVVSTIAIMLATSWKLSIAALVVAPLTILALQPVLRKLRKSHRRMGNEQGEITSMVQEVVSGIRLIKAYGAEDREEQRFMTRNAQFARGYVRIGRLTLMSGPVTETLGAVMAVAILWFGARLVLVEKTTQGLPAMDGAMLVTFLIWVMRLLQPLKQLSQVPAAAQQSLASAERIFEVLDSPAETALDSGTITAPVFERDITFEDVTFAYDVREREAAALRDVSFTAAKGEVIALVGASGAGKSTLIDLIPRFLEPTMGRITMDGLDLREIRLDALRALTGIVSQDTVLFNDTVRANVAFGRPAASQQQLEAAARAANALGFIDALPQGWETSLGERGARLSGGQRQRLAIARALLSDPPILILDEATSALDTESERLVQEAIDRLLEGRTVFVIAHRLSTVQHADRILVLDAGQIVEEGTHDSLLLQGGAYARLHALQFDARELQRVP